MLTDDQIFDRMKNGWRNGQPETICGPGSMRVHTRHIRSKLPKWVRDYGVRTLTDAGAGDRYLIDQMTWLSEVEISYYDLIPRHPSVVEWDITKDPLPECDMILCRLVLGHLDQPRREKALDLFKQSAKYLAATQFNIEDAPPDAKETVKVDLRPFLGEPLDVIHDGNHENCRLALWEL